MLRERQLSSEFAISPQSWYCLVMRSTVPRDHLAGELLRELRENRGLSPEQMPHAMLRLGIEPVSGQTIRRIERVGAVPQVRVKFALAQFFDREVKEIWMARRRQRVAA